ncbi:hypothetical protein [Leptospira licerasiae]|uniref:Membrane protein n=1 Tax=Leptospira licerasiae str. MMD4847 TaxID=1049971 RepID=A0ABN0H536_9LEPT|nr:hypothetical protein [Leptospira licerasiae]EIE00900.1 hypothetical protein LEP1GSC185_0509 [Leptospira licerasiae serovar Varillal str. VAR 010]EJZ40287.1 putative membrane protein [Leptospira licerasiae str. MMD4847]
MDFLQGFKTKNRFFYFITAVLGFAGFCISLGRVAVDPRLADFFYNSDSLFFSIIYQELFLKPGANLLISLKGFGWTPALYFFPDLAQYFALRTIFLSMENGGWELTHLSYSAFQWIFLLFGILFLLQKFSKEKIPYEKASLVLAFGLFIGIILILFKQDLFVFLPGFHGGNLTVLCWAWGIFYRWEVSNSKRDFVLVALAVFLFSLSDLLFIPYFLIPALGLHLYHWWIQERSIHKIQKVAYTYFPVFLGIVLSRILFQILRKNNFVFFPGTAAPEKITNTIASWKWESFLHSFSYLCKENWVYIVLILSFFCVLRFLQRKEEGANLTKPAYLFLILGILVPFVFLIYGFVFGLTGKAGIQGIDRYFGEILLGFLGISAVFILRISDIPIAKFAMGCLFTIGIVLGIYTSYSKGLGLTHYPAKVACLDELADKHHLKRGIASFWYVRPMRIFSKKGIEPDDYLYDLMLFYWQNNLNWFERENPPYTFAIIDGVDEKIVKRKLGEPVSIYYCDKVPIYTFADPEKSLEFIKENRSKIDLWRFSTNRY